MLVGVTEWEWNGSVAPKHQPSLQFSHICALFRLHLEGGNSAAVQELFSFLGIGTKHV